MNIEIQQEEEGGEGYKVPMTFATATAADRRHQSTLHDPSIGASLTLASAKPSSFSSYGKSDGVPTNIVQAVAGQIVELVGYDGDFKSAVFIQALSLFSMQPLVLYKAKVTQQFLPWCIYH